MFPEVDKPRPEEQKAKRRRPLHKERIIAEVLFRMGQRSKTVLPEA
jgi:hypothetical protein